MKLRKRKWNYKKVISEIKKNGYYVFENFYNSKELKEIKNSLLQTFQYIKKDKTVDLRKKYYQIKKFNPKLKSKWYDFSIYNLVLYKHVHSQDIIELAKRYFKSKIIFSARPAIHAHDHTNDYLLDPHQETNMFSKEGILLWSPLYDTNQENGGLVIYKNSHRHGFFKHKITGKKNGKKLWTNRYTQVSPTVAKKFKRIELNVKAGSAVFMINSMLHCGYPTKKKGHVRIVITERYNPLQKIPFLKKPNAPLKIPYEADYSKIIV
tara:strand:+ start:440 stop:1234 length:795 start_codon:yes stop_codon:yes gene_type:complete